MKKEEKRTKGNSSLLFLVAAIATVFLVAAVGSASAVTVINNCDFNADIPGEEYVLGQNLTCSGSEHGIKIKADNVVINGYNETDGKYYWIDGGSPGSGRWSGIWSKSSYEDGIPARDNVRIKNLEIKHFRFGIYLKGETDYGCPDAFENWTIENCIIHDNGYGHGICLLCVCNSTITKNEIYNTTGTGDSCEATGDGIFLKGPKAWGNDIIWNNIHNNRKGGIFAKMKPKYNTISYNHVWENGQAGAGEAGGIILRCKLCDYNLIAYNNASNNFMNGVYIGGSHNTIEYNVINENSRYGVNIGRGDGGDYNKLYYNTVCGNGDTDIRICGPECKGNHGNNNTCDTTSDYDDEGAKGCTYPCSVGVIADFSAEPTKGTSPLEVTFTDRSKPEGDITGWLWDFGDGNTSNEQNPVHAYYTTEPYGYYNVSLTVTGPGGASDTVTKTDYIKVWREDAAPNADFICSKGVGDPSVPVQFTDKSLGEVTSWLYEFGDGGTNSTQNPEHYYCAEGIYTVSLTVGGAGGSSKETKFNCTRVGSGTGEKWPLIDAHFFASARRGTAPFTVSFTDMSRSEAEIDSWRWDFGDGNTSSEVNPTHTYSSAGTYNVSLEVTNIAGAKSREMKIGYIVVSPLFTDYFDTGAPANPYPSIFGTHKGKIIPDRDITVNKMYTYPCMGTGGHTEYVRIWNESEGIEGTGNWSGYQGDYHNITISPAITLLKNHEYNYIIRTGSYPQIIHAREKAVEGGIITCEEFVDANGRRYDDWIPAIRLGWE